MILYQLACHEGHEFEAWFRDSKTYEKQCKSGDIVCPFCGDRDIVKALTAPYVSTKGSSKPAEKRARELAMQILQAADKSREHIERILKTLAINLPKKPGVSIMAKPMSAIFTVKQPVMRQRLDRGRH